MTLICLWTLVVSRFEEVSLNYYYNKSLFIRKHVKIKFFFLLFRRYGVVEGRFCFEGGSHCGKGEGLHVLITDQAKELAHDFDLASQGRLSPRRRPLNSKRNEGKVLKNQ